MDRFVFTITCESGVCRGACTPLPRTYRSRLITAFDNCSFQFEALADAGQRVPITFESFLLFTPIPFYPQPHQLSFVPHRQRIFLSDRSEGIRVDFIRAFNQLPPTFKQLSIAPRNYRRIIAHKTFHFSLSLGFSIPFVKKKITPFELVCYIRDYTCCVSPFFFSSLPSLTKRNCYRYGNNAPLQPRATI